jgi:hypothetical protein
MARYRIGRLMISPCSACGAERNEYPADVERCPVCGIPDSVPDPPDPFADENVQSI